MKHSQFNISIKNKNGNYIVYNTFTTSMIELDEDFNQRFNNLELTQEEMDTLTEMGYLVRDDEDELLRQKLIRNEISYQDYGKVAGLFIAPTMACNARCSYCYEAGVKHKKMSNDTIEYVKSFIINNCVTDKPLWIDWFGGEPTLGIDTILDISDFLKVHNIDFISYMTSNAYLLDKKTMEKIKDRINLKHLQITIDAIGEEYNKIKNFVYDGVDAFNVVMQNVSDILAHKDVSVGIRVNFHPNQIDRANAIVDYLNDKFGANDNISIYTAPINGINIPTVFDHYDCENPMLTLLKKTIEMGRKEAKINNAEDFDEYKYSLMAPIASHCSATRVHAYSIDADGLLYKCHRQLGQGKSVAVGDVFNGINYNDNFKFWCDGELPYSECNTCKLLPCCQGGCHIELLNKNPNAKCCRVQKGFLEELITYLYELEL